MRIIPALILMATALVAANEKFDGYCELGGQTVTTGSQTSTTKVQRSYASCTITVYTTGTLTLSTIFSDVAGTPKANPFTADANGYFFFYIASGSRFDYQMSGGGLVSPVTRSYYLVFDGATGVTNLNGLTAGNQNFATGTTGTNFGIVSAAGVHTFNIPDASGSARGLLTSPNWTTFNNKQAALTFTFPLVNTASVISLTLPLTIAQGGSGQVTKTAAFDALSPLTTKGDAIVHNGSNNIRQGVGTDGHCWKADSSTASGVSYSACLGATPITVANGGTGGSGITGAVIASGTSAFIGVAASSMLQYFRRQPNVSTTTYQFSGPHWLLATDHDFPSQAPGGTLTATVGASATLTPCPLGVNGADSAHRVYVSGGTGTAEAVLITGGTCTSGASTGTITFTPANDHSGAWTITSATQGIQEATCALSSGMNSVLVPQGTNTLNGNLSFCGKTHALIEVANGATFAGAGTIPAPTAKDQVWQDWRLEGIGSALASGASITPTNKTHHVTGVGAIATIVVPSTWPSGGCLNIIPDGVFTTTNAGNIAIASTSVVNRILTMCYDFTTSKWYPSYI